MTVKIKRIYDDPSDGDGYRVLVDRIWPRGVSKERAKLDIWLRDVGPSTDLRKWFNHEDKKWEEFRKRYRSELEGNEAIQQLRHVVGAHPVVTLLYSAHNQSENQAVVLRDFLN